MKIKFIVVGKTDHDYLKKGIEEYEYRIKHYISYEYLALQMTKGSTNKIVNTIKLKESEKLLKEIKSSDFVVLLDENGKELCSLEFAEFLKRKFNSSIKTLVFIIGGPFGFDDSIKRRADYTLSISQMTFPHQMIRLFFVEQLYRALTIINNESYHHE
jgi:23S rRNA (pseudouridine1915-N3)-methyltransferase